MKTQQLPLRTPCQLTVTESHRMSPLLLATKRFPDMLTEQLITNGFLYSTFQQSMLIVGLEYKVFVHVGTNDIVYQCNPSAPNGGWLLNTILDHRVTTGIPGASIIINAGHNGEAPSLLITVPIPPTPPTNLSIAEVMLKFEGITPLVAKIEFDVTSFMHDKLLLDLLPFGSPIPVSLVNRWINANWTAICVSENVIVNGNNLWADQLGEGYVIESLLSEHFDVSNSLCSIKSQIIPGKRKLSVSLSNTATYSRIVKIRS